MTQEVPLGRLEATICSLAAQLASSTCEWLVMIAEFDRRQGWAQWGIKSCAHWLSWACSVSQQAAREYLRVARALEKVPLITAAFAAGRLSYSKVKAVTRAIDRIAEQILLDQALMHTAAQLERVVRAFRKTDSAGIRQQESRRARWFFDDDGMLVVNARLPSDEGALLLAALRQAEHSLGVPDPDRNTWDTADALVALAQGSLAAAPGDSSGDDRTMVVLHVDAEILAEPEEGKPDVDPAGRCHLEDGPGLDRATARRLSCDAAVIAVVRSSLGRWGRGELLRLGRKTRKISPALRRALRIRDGGCQHPGCHRRRYLEAHHVVHWADGGDTDLDNLLLLCRFHHMQVHEAGFVVSRESDVWRFGRPDLVPIPATRDLIVGPPFTGRSAPPDWDPELIRPGWRGERFSVAESVGVFCRAADAPDRRTPEPEPTPSGPSAEALEDAEFYAGVKINDFARHVIPVDLPRRQPASVSTDTREIDDIDSYEKLMVFCRSRT